CNAAGLYVKSGAIITDIDNVSFANGPGTAGSIFLKVFMGASGGSYDFTGCTFDTSTTYNVATDSAYAAGQIVTMSQYGGTGGVEAREHDREGGNLTPEPPNSIRWARTFQWTGAVDTTWSTPGNWDAGGIPGPPDANSDALIPNVLNDPAMDANGVVRNLRITTGVLSFPDNPNYRLQIYGNLTNETGSISMPNNGTIETAGSVPQNVNTGGSALRNLEVNSTSTVTLQSNTTCTGALTVVSGTLATGGFNLLVSGAASIGAGAVLDIGGGAGEVRISGNFDASSGSVSFSVAGGLLRLGGGANAIGSFSGGTGKVEYIAGSAQSVAPVAYYNLKVAKTPGTTATLSAGTTTCTGTLEITSGTLATGGATLDASGAGGVTFTGAGTFSIGAGGTVNVAGPFNSSAGTVSLEGGAILRLFSTSAFGTLAPNTGTVAFVSTTAAQTVPAAAYYNLRVDKTAQTATAGAGFTVAGVLDLVSGAFDAAGFTVNITGSTTVANGAALKVGSGTVNSNGAFDATNGTVQLTGTGRLAFGGTVSAAFGSFSAANGSTVAFVSGGAQNVPAVAYHNLEIAKSGGSTATLSGAAASAAGALAVNSGTL
ncbi:MAG: hypothetical protein RDV41_03000, partial [Planctomycetota bacterium]|nr:hypothetical protein [Planctomycetota bacterium]